MRRYEALEQVLMDQLGVTPSPEAVALRERALALSSVGTQPAPAPLPRQLRIERPLGAVAGGLIEREEPLLELARRPGRCPHPRARFGRPDRRGGGLRQDLVAVGVPRRSPRAGRRGRGRLRRPAGLALARSVSGHGLDPPWRGSRARRRQGDDAFAGVLTVMARPTVMAIEDVHWADDATFDVVRYLSRRIAALPSLLILTVRDDAIDPGHPLRRLLGGLSGPSVRRLSLAPLEPSGRGAAGRARLGRRRRRRAAPGHARQRLLRHRGPGGRRCRRSAHRPRRRARSHLGPRAGRAIADRAAVGRARTRRAVARPCARRRRRRWS